MAVTLSAYISPFNLNILRPPPAARVCVCVCRPFVTTNACVCVPVWLKTSPAKDSEKVSPKLRLKCAPQSDSQREAEILSTCCNCQVARPTSRRQLRLTACSMCGTCRHGETATQRHRDNRKRKWRPGEMLVITKMKNWSYRGVVNVMSPWFRQVRSCDLPLITGSRSLAAMWPSFFPQFVCTQRATDKKRGLVGGSIFNVHKVKVKIENIGKKCITQSVFIT